VTAITKFRIYNVMAITELRFLTAPSKPRDSHTRTGRSIEASETEPAAILRDGASRLLQDEVCGFKLNPPDPIGFMESI
jgi:hypothetical protein